MTSDGASDHGGPPRNTPADVQIPLQISQRSYVPHVFDLVTPTREAARLTKAYIPPVFLEAGAVDSAMLLGHGASFTASRQALPAGDKRLKAEIQMSGWSVTSDSPASRRPNYIVYKTARVAFEGSGEPIADHRRALESVLTEFHALIYPRLYHHPNIIDFLGLAWGSNPYDPTHKLPVLVVEYADHGTLEDLQRRAQRLPQDTKIRLGLDVALALRELHECGIVHGDVKSQNILIFSHPQRAYVAKVANFGFSVVEAMANSEVTIGGTQPWKAPESRAPISAYALKLTDIFSFGLLLWTIAINGKNPFDLIIPSQLHGSARTMEIERLKQEDELTAASRVSRWLMTSLAADLKSRYVSRLVNSMRSLHISADEDGKGKAEVKDQQADLVDSGSQHSIGSLNEKYLRLCQRDVLHSKLDEIFARSLGTNPSTRDLNAVIELLSKKDSNAEQEE